MKKKAKFHLIFSVLLIAFSLNNCEELLELGCQDSTQCKQYELKGIAVSCENGSCRCWQSNNNNNNSDSDINNKNTNQNQEKHQQNTSRGQSIECRPKDYVKSNLIGGACPCTIRAAECDEEQRVCYCARDFVASADRRRCLKKTVPLGDACETDAQCATADIYAVCNGTHRLCQCGPGFVKHDGTCLSIVGSDPTFNCFEDAQCEPYGPGAFCSSTSKKCLCLAAYISVADKLSCIPISDYKEKCSEVAQCMRKLGLGASCDDGTCRCKGSYFVQQQQLPNGSEWTACKPIVALGSYCRTQDDCYQHHLSRSSQSMHCSYAECNCRIGYNNAIENVSCTPDNANRPENAGARLEFSSWLFILFQTFGFGLLLKRYN